MTSQFMVRTRMVCPSGSSPPNSWSTTIWPSTHTLLAVSTSRWPKKAPRWMFQARTWM